MGSRHALAVTAFVGYEETGNGGGSLITDPGVRKKYQRSKKVRETNVKIVNI